MSKIQKNQEEKKHCTTLKMQKKMFLESFFFKTSFVLY